MAREVSLLELRTRAQQLAQMENSTFITTAEWNDYINVAFAKYHTLLVESRGMDRFVKSASISTFAGNASYPLPADHFETMGIDINFNSFTNTMTPFQFEQRNWYKNAGWGPNQPVAYRIVGNNLTFIPTPNGPFSLTHWYIPAAVKLTLDTDKFDGVDGWDQFVCWEVVAMALAKEESDNSYASSQAQQWGTIIAQAAPNRDAEHAPRARDVFCVDRWNWWAS